MLVLLSLLACMHPSSITTLSEGHYLVTDDYNRLYDCYSAPVGRDWRPTCVRVDYSHEVPGWVRARYETIGGEDPGAVVLDLSALPMAERPTKGPGYIVLGRHTPKPTEPTPPAEPSTEEPKDSP